MKTHAAPGWVVLWLVALLVAPATADPRSDYMLHCQGCHRPDGSGLPGGAPAFRGAIGRLARIPDGRSYLIRVPGVAQSELSDARTASLLNWLIGEFDAPAAVPRPFTAAEVNAVRRVPLVEIGTLRSTLLEKTQP